MKKCCTNKNHRILVSISKSGVLQFKAAITIYTWRSRNVLSRNKSHYMLWKLLKEKRNLKKSKWSHTVKCVLSIFIIQAYAFFKMRGAQNYCQERIKLLACGPLICINVAIKYRFFQNWHNMPHSTSRSAKKHLSTICSCVFGTQNCLQTVFPREKKPPLFFFQLAINLNKFSSQQLQWLCTRRVKNLKVIHYRYSYYWRIFFTTCTTSILLKFIARKSMVKHYDIMLL